MPWRGSSRLPDERRAGGRYNHVDPWVRDNPEANQSALDIEDLGRLGRGSGPCPYYTARALADSADLVFLPYNYLARPMSTTDVLITLT